ncbi:Uncharacterized protein BM_BM12968 [Brugia malayi]|uniref:Uncharacterized protein n=1 Tax=Brugia malayi TaxID=6279 RepID=A0A4E9FK79_BRUMA|nr:Uncharacterized protein BM_BM12968 [Brugia malayi]VIO96844.1 Uncharacterized protein BM_BM12968 [Brugia malayi]
METGWKNREVAVRLRRNGSDDDVAGGVITVILVECLLQWTLFSRVVEQNPPQNQMHTGRCSRKKYDDVYQEPHRRDAAATDITM